VRRQLACVPKQIDSNRGSSSSSSSNNSSSSNGSIKSVVEIVALAMVVISTEGEEWEKNYQVGQQVGE
jgi:hypothetical protein